MKSWYVAIVLLCIYNYGIANFHLKLRPGKGDPLFVITTHMVFEESSNYFIFISYHMILIVSHAEQFLINCANYCHILV